MNRFLHEAASLRGVCLAASAALLLANGQLVEATPESTATALFLLISPSVRVNGMGQAGVALADEPASYYNPAATAFSSPGHTFQSRFYVSGMPWLPALADDMTYSHHAAQISGGGELDHSSWWKPTRFRAAFYGYRTKMDLGRQQRMGEVTGSFTSVETSDNVGVSLALRSVVEVGIGAISKRISSRFGDLKGAADAYDFGFMAVLPTTEAFKRLTGRELSLIAIVSGPGSTSGSASPGRIAAEECSRIRYRRTGAMDGRPSWQSTGTPIPSVFP